MNKYAVLVFLMVFYIGNFLSQDFNKELLKSYSQTELNSFSSEEVLMLVYALENACYFTPIPDGKTVDFPELILKKNTVQFTDLGIKITDKTQYFIVKNQNKLLVVKSNYILHLEIKNKK